MRPWRSIAEKVNNIIAITDAELKKLYHLHDQSELLVSSLVEMASHADFGSDEAYRLNRLVDKDSTRAERRYQAKVDAIKVKNQIPTDVSLGYVTVDGFLRHCKSGSGRELPSDFKEWANPLLNKRNKGPFNIK